MPQLLQKLAGNTDGLVDGFHHMHRNTDGAGLVGDRSRDGLADPPRRVGGKLVAFGIVELFHGFDQAEIALLDQIQKQHPAADIALCDGHHEAEVGFRHALFGRLVAVRHARGKLHFLLRGEQWNFADLLEVHPHRVVDRVGIRDRIGVGIQLLLGDLFDLGDLLDLREKVVVKLGKDIGIRNINVDIVGFQILIELIDGFFGKAEFVQQLEIILGQLSVFSALFHQGFQLLLRRLGLFRLRRLSCRFLFRIFCFSLCAGLSFRACFSFCVGFSLRLGLRFCVSCREQRVRRRFQLLFAHGGQLFFRFVFFLFCAHALYPFPSFFLRRSASCRRSGAGSTVSRRFLIVLT